VNCLYGLCVPFTGVSSFPFLALGLVSGHLAAVDINAACGRTPDPILKMGYYGISWEFVEVNGLTLFSHGKSQWFQ
jgi:hypothetical protein